MYANTSFKNKLIQIAPLFATVIFVIFLTTYSLIYFTFESYISCYIRIPLTIIQNILTLLSIFSQFLCAFTNPGEVPYNYKYKKGNHQAQYCTICKVYKPPRAHHCKKCNKCILKMDHHCPLIANCVGLNNQKFFCQLTFFAFLASVSYLISYIIILCNYHYYHFKGKKSKKANEVKGFMFYISKYFNYVVFWFFTIYLCLFIVSFGSLLARNIIILLHNSTFFEERSLEKKEDNVYYNSDECESFRMVMGKKWYIWLLPKFTIEKGNDGFAFKNNKSTKKETTKTQGENITYEKLDESGGYTDKKETELSVNVSGGNQDSEDFADSEKEDQ